MIGASLQTNFWAKQKPLNSPMLMIRTSRVINHQSIWKLAWLTAWALSRLHRGSSSTGSTSSSLPLLHMYTQSCFQHQCNWPLYSLNNCLPNHLQEEAPHWDLPSLPPYFPYPAILYHHTVNLTIPCHTPSTTHWANTLPFHCSTTLPWLLHKSPQLPSQSLSSLSLAPLPSACKTNKDVCH